MAVIDTVEPLPLAASRHTLNQPFIFENLQRVVHCCQGDPRKDTFHFVKQLQGRGMVPVGHQKMKQGKPVGVDTDFGG